MSEPRELVFVYGTLRRGGSNHFRMAGADFVAQGAVRGRLYGIAWYPGLVLDREGGEVIGDVMAVDAGMMAELDAYEGGEYRRVRVEVGLPHGEIIEAWIWEWGGEVDESRRIAGGDWLAPTE
jgi:gamma-glutamylcyclotransferase (GGCT)/AIG2-like uncharacterized protein YtfP